MRIYNGNQLVRIRLEYYFCQKEQYQSFVLHRHSVCWHRIALATCNSDDIWDGSVPLYSPDICLDESQHRLDLLFMSKEKGEHSLPSPISDNSSPSQNSMIEMSPSIDSMFFQQPGIASPDRKYMMTSQSSSADKNIGLSRPAEVWWVPWVFVCAKEGYHIFLSPLVLCADLSTRQSSANFIFRSKSCRQTGTQIIFPSIETEQKRF